MAPKKIASALEDHRNCLQAIGCDSDKRFWRNVFLPENSEFLRYGVQLQTKMNKSKKSFAAPKRLRVAPETLHSLKRAYLGLSNAYLGLLWNCLSSEKSGFFWAGWRFFFENVRKWRSEIQSGAQKNIFLKKIVIRAQKNPLFSKLRQFQRNPRYALESPWYALSSEYRVLGVIRSIFIHRWLEVVKIDFFRGLR